MSVPTYAIGELVFVRNAVAARTPSVVVALVSKLSECGDMSLPAPWRKSRTSGSDRGHD